MAHGHGDRVAIRIVDQVAIEICILDLLDRNFDQAAVAAVFGSD